MSRCRPLSSALANPTSALSSLRMSPAASDGECRALCEWLQSFPLLGPLSCCACRSRGARAMCRVALTGGAVAVVAALLSAATALPQAQHDALIDFYDATNGPYWSGNYGWLELPEPWYFVRLHVMRCCRSSCCLHRPCRESTWGRGLHCRRCVVIAARGLVWIARPTTPPSPV